MQNEAQEYIKNLFEFADSEVRKMELDIWRKHIEVTAPLEKSARADFFRKKKEEVLAQCGNDLFTTWLVMFAGMDNEPYKEKLWSCRNMYAKQDFQVWYWQVYQKYLWINNWLKDCDDYYKYKGIANALKDYITGADDEILIRLICTKEEFESQAKWLGTKADAVRFADCFNISLKRMNKAFSANLNAKNLGSDLWKDKDRRGILTILDRFR